MPEVDQQQDGGLVGVVADCTAKKIALDVDQVEVGSPELEHETAPLLPAQLSGPMTVSPGSDSPGSGSPRRLGAGARGAWDLAAPAPRSRPWRPHRGQPA